MAGAEKIVIAKVWGVAEPAALVADRVTLVVPAVVGVPEMAPVEAFTASPAGKGAAPKVMGAVPEAVMV
jgi:hypothetical protein